MRYMNKILTATCLYPQNAMQQALKFRLGTYALTFPPKRVLLMVFFRGNKKGVRLKKYIHNHKKRGTELGIAKKQIQLVVRT